MNQSLKYGAHNFLTLLGNSASRQRDKTAPVLWWRKPTLIFGLGNQMPNRAFSAANNSNNRDCHDGKVDNEMVLTDEDIEVIKRHTLACKVYQLTVL